VVFGKPVKNRRGPRHCDRVVLPSTPLDPSGSGKAGSASPVSQETGHGTDVVVHEVLEGDPP